MITTPRVTRLSLFFMSHHPARCHSHEGVPGARAEDKEEQIHQRFHKASFPSSFFKSFKIKISLLSVFYTSHIFVVFVNPDVQVWKVSPSWRRLIPIINQVTLLGAKMTHTGLDNQSSQSKGNKSESEGYIANDLYFCIKCQSNCNTFLINSADKLGFLKPPPLSGCRYNLLAFRKTLHGSSLASFSPLHSFLIKLASTALHGEPSTKASSHQHED